MFLRFALRGHPRTDCCRTDLRGTGIRPRTRALPRCPPRRIRRSVSPHLGDLCYRSVPLICASRSYHGFYPSDPAHSDSFARVVSVAHADHIANTLRETSGTVVLGGTVDAPERYVAPTVVRDVRADDALMDGELFAPVLCVVPGKDVDEALEIIISE